MPVNDNYQTLNLAQQRTDERSYFKYYQQLSKLRTKDDFALGDFRSKAFDNDVFAYKRSFNGSSHIILINFGSAEHTVNVNEINEDDATLPEQLTVTVAGSKSSYWAGNKITTNALVLKAYDAIVVTDGASSIFGSVLLMLAAILIKCFV